MKYKNMIFLFVIIGISLSIVIYTQQLSQNYSKPIDVDVGSLIKIDNKSDIDEKKNFLMEFFWDVGTLHSIISKSPLPQVESDISDSRYDYFQNLKRIDRLTVEMEYDINSISYLFIPEKSNEKLILYH